MEPSGRLSGITSKLSERPLKSADQKTERGKILNPEYSIDRDQPTSQASPLRINDLLYRDCGNLIEIEREKPELKDSESKWSIVYSTRSQFVSSFAPLCQQFQQVVGL